MPKKDKIVTVNLQIPKELFDRVTKNIIGDSLEEKFAKCLVVGYKICRRKTPKGESIEELVNKEG